MNFLKNIQTFYFKHKDSILLAFRVLSFLTLVYLLKDIIKGRAPTQDVISVSFILIAFIISRGKKFIIDWLPIFIFFYLYELVRGHAYIVQEFFNIPVHKTILLEWEQAIFGKNIPTLIFQRFIHPAPTWIDYFAMFMYTSFFWGAFLTGFVLWLKSRKFFLTFRNAYIFLCYTGVLTYLFFPAYPPWLASQEGYLPPLQTNTWGRLGIGASTLGVFKSTGYNLVAPMPSLHTGWSVLSAIMFDTYFKKKIGIFSKLIYLYPLGMFFVIIYTSDHYVVDIIGGILYAVVASQFGFKSHKIFKKIKEALSLRPVFVGEFQESYNLNYKLSPKEDSKQSD